MTKSYTAGGYIDSWCSTCKMELGHTIVAMMGEIPHIVTCNTCKGKHRFRNAPRANKRPAKKRTPARKAPEADPAEYIQMLNRADTSNARTYRMADSYERDDIVNHPRFGIGFVEEIITNNKIRIIFKDGLKLLLQNR